MIRTNEKKAMMPNRIPVTMILACKRKARILGLSTNEWLQNVLTEAVAITCVSCRKPIELDDEIAMIDTNPFHKKCFNKNIGYARKKVESAKESLLTEISKTNPK